MAVKTFWQKQKQKIINDLTMLIEGVDLSESQEKIDKFFVKQIKPKDFMSDMSDEVKHEKAFEDNCLILSQYTNEVVKNMNVKEYFTLLEFHKDRIKQQSHGRQSNKTR